MSLSAVSQIQTSTRGLDNMAGTAPNGAPNSPPIGAVHFGNFHDEIHEKIQTLRSGMSTVDNAVTGLSNTFGKYQKIVRTVGKRYDNDKDLEDENSELKAANKEFLRMAQEDRDDYEKRITEQKRRHEEEVATLLDQANAGEQEKRRYEEMEKKLTEQHDLLRQKTAKDLKQRKAQLEKENVDKIAALKEEKVALESSKGELEEQLRQRTVERNQEMEARQTMQTTLNAEITKLENALNDIQAKYRVEPRSSDFYMKEYNGLIDRVGWIATEYFTDLPPKALDDPVSTFDRSSKAMAGFSGFVQIPISGSEYSRVLRLAIVQHIIFNAICDPVWQRFYSVYVGNVKREQMLLPKIYARAQVQGEAVQQHWKVSTLRALDLLDESADVGMVIQELIDQRIVAALKYLLDFERLDRFKTDLRNVFYDAFKMGRMAWIDQSPVIYSINPSVSDHVGWKEFWGEAEEMKDTAEPAPTSPVADSPRTEPLFVSPKIYRRVVRTATTSTATTSAATVGAGQREEEIIRPGYALFPDTGIFQLGAWDWRRIRNAGREAARGINGSGRAMSMSTSGPAAGSGPGLSSPTFPQVPSKKWSPEGAPDFD